MATRTHSPSSPLLVLCPTLHRPANVARLRASYLETATDASALEFIHGEGTCVEKMNAAAWGHPGIRAVMFVGDDHMFGTPGWDKLMLDRLTGGCHVAWPDVPGDRYCHPTVWAMTTDLLAALGWFMLPTQRHYYVDDAIAQIGIRAGVAAWLPEVSMPHLHWRLTGGQSDDVYERAMGWLDEDRESYWRWLREDSENDVQRVRNCL